MPRFKANGIEPWNSQADAAAAVSRAPPTPESGGDVGDRHHRRHGRLLRLLFAALPLVRALPSGAGRAGDAPLGSGG